MCESGGNVMDWAKLKKKKKTVRELFMFGLKHENKKITQAQAGDLMDAYCEEGGDINELSSEIMTCLAKALGGKVEDVEDDDEGDEGK